MILYFANRKLEIIGQASTELPKGLTIVEDKKSEDVETGVAVFECTIPFNDATREKVENCATVGNYILRSYNGENEFYTIIDSESDTKNQEVYVYAEDAGLDLLNEIVGAYEADAAYPIAHYIDKFAHDSGFEIGVNEVANLTRQLMWDGEQTVTERIASIATQFDGAEVSYSFAIDGMNVVSKFINIYKERGKDINEKLRLNKDIDRIITKKSIANLATALKCTGATPEQTTQIIEVSSDAGSPKVLYKVSLETKSRTANSVVILASVSGSLDAEASTLNEGYVLSASIYMGGAWHKVTLKATDESWKGTSAHSKEFQFTVSGIPAGEKTFTDIKFAVSREDTKGGNVGILASKSCSQYVVTNYIQGGVNGEGISERPMTLEGYVYDDGDFYVDGTYLKSRTALAKWHRFGLADSTTQGHIERPFSYETLSQAELCAHSITELKKLREIEVNYEVDINKLPDYIRIGDRIDIVDDAGNLYVSARVLKLETSAVKDKHDATLGEYLIKGSGISQRVEELAAQFAVSAAANRKAREDALKAAKEAEAAKLAAEKAEQEAQQAEQKAESANNTATEAQQKAEQAEIIAESAVTSADEAKTLAQQAQNTVDDLTNRVTTAETRITQTNESITSQAKKIETAQSTADGAVVLVNSNKSEIQQLADMIASLVIGQNGETLMTQTDNKWQFDMTNILNTLSSAATDVDALNNEMNSANSSIDTLKQSLNDLGVFTDYVVITTYNGQPCIELGESENEFKVRITNTEIQFADGTTIPAYINNKKLMIEQAEVKGELHFGGKTDDEVKGGWVWKKRSNGNLGLSWKDVNA